MNDDAVERALDDCFDAVFAPERWAGAMDALGTSLGALGCCLNPNSRTTADRFRLPASTRYRDMLGEFVSGGWKAHDLRNSRGWRLAVAGKPLVFESDCSSAEERRALPIYAELFRRHELEIFVGVGLRVDNEPWTLNLVRSEDMGGFEHGGVDQLLAVRPTMRRLLRVASQMSVTAARNAVSAFEHSGLASVLVDSHGRMLEVNDAAQILMGEGLDVRHHRLVAHAAPANSQLQALIAAATQSVRGAALAPVYVRRADKPPLIVEAVEMKNLRAEYFGFSGALLVITDPQVRRKPRLEMLRQGFGLTTQEAKAARLFAAGLGISEIAEILELRRSSVQQIVKAVMAKTDTRRQGELVALLARMPGEQ